ncbi:unnamed protein product [Heligmosomoides polygyrus]|uniref:BTP domain-containing protein n=1 Tax=Heligmosomoides polygyrus TaxID=6339 RepID=A0A183GW08_HELPZ|nr:unnamed protein product [Heligmosomoides polygyrus]
MLFSPQPSPAGYEAASVHIPGMHIMRHRFFASGSAPESESSFRIAVMAQVDKKPFAEDSRVSIFNKSRYKIGVDHTAWNHAYALGIIRQLGIRQDLITEAAIDAVMSIATQVVRDVLSSAVHLVAKAKRMRLEPRDVENSVDLKGLMVGCHMLPTVYVILFILLLSLVRIAD